MDADDTLFDFQKAQKTAFRMTLQHLGLECGDREVDLYEKINRHYWRELELGKIERKRLYRQRYEDLFRELGVALDAESANRIYFEQLGSCTFLNDGAALLCRILSQQCTLVIATNGASETQRSRVEQSEIAPFISHLAISEDAGAVKPEPLFFEYALSMCGCEDRRRAIMVGDSLSADMGGAHSSGIATCWYNPNHLPVPEEPPIDCVLHDLKELIPIVTGKPLQTRSMQDSVV